MARGGATSSNAGNGGTRIGGSNGGSRFANLEIPNSDRSPAEDFNSPCFLSNGDHPGLNLVSHQLMGENYNTRSRAMSMALTAKNKLCFIDGTLSRPNLTDLLYNSWCRCNSMVMSWILNAVSKEIADSLMYIDTAVDVWIDLYDRFHQSNGPRVFQIKQQLNSLSQGSNDVTTYYTKLKILWDELKDFRPILICNCGGMKTWMDYQQQEYVLQFLMGLNELYAQIRAQVLKIDLLPPINKVFSLVVQEERQKRIGASSFSSTDSVVFGMSANPSGSFKGKRDRPLCTHCGIVGHVMDKCYKLHGYPPGYKFKNQFSQSKLVANQASIASDSYEDPSAMSSLSSNQCQQLIALLSSHLQQNSSQSSGEPLVSNFTGMHSTIPIDAWILDTGATHHVCHTLHSFKSFVSSSISAVILSNAQHDHESSSSINYPLSQVIDYKHLSPSFRAAVLSISTHFEPQFYS
ncbi:hypothetical protein LWI28_027130 [Acer negundo]|uniref:Retrotransposon gag domain-containing protein n=1 Tax=Acer negundo TaxID=4023 RepID=A0AAD5IGP7_ACENE|nr:hypothetical protein LWI28_027130 [Acer negundo]